MATSASTGTSSTTPARVGDSSRRAARPRPDAPLIRHIAATWGREVAARYQALPYFLVPDDGLSAYIEERQREIHELLRGEAFLPWPDSIFDLGPHLHEAAVRADAPTGRAPKLTDTLARTGAFVRLTAQTPYLRARATHSPWLPAAAITALEPAPMTAVMETWLLLDGAIITPTPAVTFLPLGVAEGWDRVQSIVPRDMDRRLRHASEWLVGHTLLVLGYVNLSAEYMVYAEPVLSPREQRLDRKSTRRRVDLRLGMGHYLLIDPARSGAYGHPSGGRSAAGTKSTGGPRTAGPLALSAPQTLPPRSRDQWGTAHPHPRRVDWRANLAGRGTALPRRRAGGDDARPVTHTTWVRDRPQAHTRAARSTFLAGTGRMRGRARKRGSCVGPSGQPRDPARSPRYPVCR